MTKHEQSRLRIRDLVKDFADEIEDRMENKTFFVFKCLVDIDPDSDLYKNTLEEYETYSVPLVEDALKELRGIVKVLGLASKEYFKIFGFTQHQLAGVHTFHCHEFSCAWELLHKARIGDCGQQDVLNAIIEERAAFSDLTPVEEEVVA